MSGMKIGDAARMTKTMLLERMQWGADMDAQHAAHQIIVPAISMSAKSVLESNPDLSDRFKTGLSKIAAITVDTYKASAEAVAAKPITVARSLEAAATATAVAMPQQPNTRVSVRFNPTLGM